MKSKTVFKVLCVSLGIMLLFAGCSKKNQTEETTIDPLIQVQPTEPGVLTVPTGTNAGSQTTVTTPDSSIIVPDMSTETAESSETTPVETNNAGEVVLYDDNNNCDQDPDSGYLGEPNDGAQPTKNTMTQNDLAQQTYPVDGGYHVYPLPHKDYVKIGYQDPSEVMNRGAFSMTVTEVKTDESGYILLSGSYEDPETTESVEITVRMAGVRCFTDMKYGALNAYCANYILNTLIGGKNRSVVVELDPDGALLTSSDTLDGYIWLCTTSGNSFYMVQEWLLCEGFVEPWTIGSIDQYKTYFEQYPELYRS